MELELNTLDQINRIKERCQDIKPLVVIRCITYNHEPYIKDALEGFVMQKTDFPVVAIVHDDASTDNTAAIIREYAEKYPDIIFPIYETENQYSKRDGSLGKIMKAAQDATEAKYVALCEGDDYWTDPLKLQKQVDILNNSTDVSLVYTGFNNINEKGEIFYRKHYEEYMLRSKSGHILSELFRDNFILTCTTCFRLSAFNSDLVANCQTKLDYSYFLGAASLGRCVYIPERTSNYRLSPTGLTSQRKNYVHNIVRDTFMYYAIKYLSGEIKNQGAIENLKIKINLKSAV